jgi:hypothetical protein
MDVVWPVVGPVLERTAVANNVGLLHVRAAFVQRAPASRLDLVPLASALFV